VKDTVVCGATLCDEELALLAVYQQRMREPSMSSWLEYYSGSLLILGQADLLFLHLHPSLRDIYCSADLKALRLVDKAPNFLF
jgi:hypothetical protein